MQEDRGQGVGLGCLILPGMLVLLGVVLALAGYVAGDTTAFNRSTGDHSTIGPTLYILAVVFGGIGAVGLGVALWPTKGSDG
jgi:predicted anti-sigma-YlaC factor YlaD